MRRHDAAEDIGVALDPGTGAIFGGLRGGGAHACEERRDERQAHAPVAWWATIPPHGLPPSVSPQRKVRHPSLLQVSASLMREAPQGCRFATILVATE